MKSYQKWEILGVIAEITKLDSSYGTIKGKIIFETKKGRAQFRYFKCSGDIAESLFNEYEADDKILLTGFHDSEEHNGGFYAVMVVEDYKIIKD